MLWALDQATGNVKWKKRVPEEMLWPAVVAGEQVLLTAQPYLEEKLSILYSFSAIDGREMWNQDLVTTSNGHDFRPTITGKRLVVWCGDFDYFKKYGSSGAIRLMCYDTDNGQLQ